VWNIEILPALKNITAKIFQKVIFILYMMQHNLFVTLLCSPVPVFFKNIEAGVIAVAVNVAVVLGVIVVARGAVVIVVARGAGVTVATVIV